MRHFFKAILMAVACGPALFGEDITYPASDGVTVHATFEAAAGGEFAPYVILFHQAGANGRAEYEKIASRLVDEGYHVLMVDQRSGGDRFGGENRTVAALGMSTGFCEAYPDLEASVDHVVSTGHKGPVFVIGSSYSAGLSVRLAGEKQDSLAGIIAFSPAAGGPMQACSPNPLIPRARMPILVMRPIAEMDRPSTQYQADLFAAAGHQVHLAENGVHGASMMDDSRTGQETKREWKVVLDYLNDVSMAWKDCRASEESCAAKE